jgi:hypothetical protein
MSHNRLVFAASFAILALAAVGLEVLLDGPAQWRQWFCVPSALLVALCGWCAFRTVFLPEPLDTQLEGVVLSGQQFGWIHDVEGVRRAQSWFVRHYAWAAGWCGLGAVGWWFLWWRGSWRARLLPLICVLLLGDLLWFAYGRSVQSDPALYFPPLPVLQQVARSTPGRIIGSSVLPPNLAAMCGLRDIRGYDAVDPSRMVDLILAATDPASPTLPYALTQWRAPLWRLSSAGELQFSPILDMLDVRYVIGRGDPRPEMHPAFRGPDYFVLVNPSALGRVFLPQRVELEADDKVRLQKISFRQFNPREVAYVESALALPISCHGTARILEEIPTRITVSVSMETPGLVVLADLWDKNWHAFLNGEPVPILRTNHAIRGVVVPAGSGTLVFRYEPASFTWGLRLAALAAGVLLIWLTVLLWKRPSSQSSPQKYT